MGRDGLTGLLLFFLVASVWSAPRRGIIPDSIPIWVQGPVVDSSKTNELTTDTLASTLETSGSKSVKVHVGEGGADIGQELRLSIQGEASPGLRVEARLTDVGRSAGDQVTATLQEVDEMYFRLENDHGFAQLGDLSWNLDRMGLMGIRRSTLGAAGAFRTERAEVRALYGLDETDRRYSVFVGNAGQQKGYVLAAKREFVVVVPSSERVFLNGRELTAGKDYQLNAAGGVIDFLGGIIPGPSDEIRVEYEVYRSGNLQLLRLAEAGWRSRNIWLDVAGFELAADLDRMRKGAWSEFEWAKLTADRGEVPEMAGDSGIVLERPQGVRRVGARFRGQWGERWFMDLEAAMNRVDSNLASSHVGGPSGRSLRWEVDSDSSRTQRYSPLKVQIRGDRFEPGYSATDFQGSWRNWDSYMLRDRWDLDSSGLDGGLRSDEVDVRVRLPRGWFPGWYQGYRRGMDDSSGWNSLRSRGYLRRMGEDIESEIAVERVASFQQESVERWQGESRASILIGNWRPFMETRASLWKRSMNRDTLLRATSGTEWGRLGSPIYAKAELLGERSDTSRVAQWTQNGDWRGRGWQARHLFQYRTSQSDSAGESGTWLVEQGGRLGNESSPLRMEGNYTFGYTSEIPWIPLYKSVPAGTGDVLYDSLAGEYVEGVDNGDYVYVGMGRSDTAVSVRTAHSRMELSMGCDLGMALGIREGFARDLALEMRGEWEAWDTLAAWRGYPPLTPAQLRNRDEGLVHGEGSVLWTHPHGKGSVELSGGGEDEKDGGTIAAWTTRRWGAWENRYTGRPREIWTTKMRKSETRRRALLDVDWRYQEIALSWRRELPAGFAIEPAGRGRLGRGDDGFTSLSSSLLQGGLTAYWQNSEKSSARLGASWTQVESASTALPYELMDGFGIGRTWRGEAQVLVSAHEHFQLSLTYVVRYGDAETRLFQKMSTEAKAYF